MSSVNIALRKSTGEIFKTTASKRDISLLMQNLDLFISPDKVIDSYIKENKQSGFFNITAPLAPESYGILVFDALKNKIHSFQEYTNPLSVFPPSNLSFLIDQKNKNSNIPYITFDDIISEREKKEVFNFYQLFTGSKLLLSADQMRRDSKNSKILENLMASDKTADEKWKELLLLLSTPSLFSSAAFTLNLSLSPFTLTHAMDGKEPLKAMKKELEKDGFVFSSLEKSIWKEFIKDQYE